tara:strand:- start:403 stop:1446 length:1044 start_codon:yes stop_codon:yes gene_type:complete
LKKHVLIDFLNREESHLDFNKSFIKAIPSEYSDFKFIGNYSHVKHLNVDKASLLNKDAYSWPKRVISLFFKLLFSNKKHITVLAFENYFFPTLTILFFPFFIGKRFTLVIHNNIASFISGGLKNIPLRFMIVFFNVKLICLTESGKEKMDELGFSKSANFIPHMNYCHFKKGFNSTNLLYQEKKVNIAIIGRQAHIFANKIAPKINLEIYKNLHFHVYGLGINLNSSKNISLIKKRLSVHEFRSVLAQCDFCFFPNIEVGYRPSGILLDSLSNKCPVFAPLEGHFSEFKNENIGVFYAEANLQDKLMKINSDRIKRYNFPDENFKESLNITSLDLFSQKLSDHYLSF